jgi:hypothetical protein
MTTAGPLSMRAHPGTPSDTRQVLRDPRHLLLVAGVGTSVALHGQMAISGMHGTVWSLVMAAMAAICLPCLVALVKSKAAPGPVRMTMGTALAMALTHVLMLPLLNTSSGAHAHHHAAQMESVVATSGGNHGAMLAVIAVELAVAAMAAGCMRRHARCSTTVGAASTTAVITTSV